MEPDGEPRGQRLILAATILASSLAFVDGSVVNVGLPAIGRSLGASGASLPWIVNSYLLPLSALLLLGGAAGDRYGRRKLLLIGIALFAVASLLCALAPSLGWLLAGRALQGVGAAMLMPNSLAILGASFRGEARGRAIGTWAAVGAGAGALGPVIGGWLIDTITWRAIFLINLPVALAAFLLTARHIADPVRVRQQAPDFLGAALATAALGSLTWGLTAVSAGQGGFVGLGALLAGAALFVLFLVSARRRGDTAMLPLSIFASASFSGLNLLTFFLYGALGGLFILLPYVLIEAWGYSATMAGAALLPLPVVIALASPTMGRIASRVGSRLPLILGSLIVAAGFAVAARIGDGGGYWTTVFPAMFVIAIGMAGAVAPLTTAVLSSVPTTQTGIASGFNSAVARTGGLVATAAVGFVLTSQESNLVGLAAGAAWGGVSLALAAAFTGAIWVRNGVPARSTLKS